MLNTIIEWSFYAVQLNVIVIAIFMKKFTHNFSNARRIVKSVLAMTLPMLAWIAISVLPFVTA